MSRRRLWLLEPPDPVELDDEDEEDDEDEVEYLLDADEEVCWRTSVPNSTTCGRSPSDRTPTPTSRTSTADSMTSTIAERP